MKAIKGSAAKGMILPFEPMPLTFHKICYYVPFPKVSSKLDPMCKTSACVRSTYPWYCQAAAQPAIPAQYNPCDRA